MKKTLLLFGLLTAGFTIFSQVTITSADLPNEADTVLVSTTEQFNDVDYTTTGANQTWDFSHLVATAQRIDTFYTMPSAFSTYGFVYNNGLTAPNYQADYYNTLSGSAIPAVPGGVITIENPVFFTKNTTVSSSIVGLGMEINGVEVPAKADTIDVVYHYPMNFMDSWDSTSYLYLDLNPAVNGMFKRHQSRSSQVDGWGQITTPYGTFDALRVKSTVTYTDSVYFDLGFGGAWNAIPTPQEVEYTWWTNNNKIPVLKIVTQAGAATSIEYRDHVVDGFVSIEFNETTEFKVYPNPSNGKISISTPSISSALIEIMDINGRIVYQNQMSGNTDNVDVSSWLSGVYLVRIITNEKVATQTLIVK